MLELSRRLGDDSIRAFENAAAGRWLDAEGLRVRDRRLAAIYLYGYSTEMWIKAAYFRLIGYGDDQIIPNRIRMSEARRYETSTPPLSAGSHDIVNWARLLIRRRADLDRAHERGLAQEIVTRSERLYLNWRETLRYRSIPIRRPEIDGVRAEAGWFRSNHHRL